MQRATSSYADHLLEEEERGEAFDQQAISNVLVLRTVNLREDARRVLLRQDLGSRIVLRLQFLTVAAKSSKMI